MSVLSWKTDPAHVCGTMQNNVRRSLLRGSSGCTQSPKAQIQQHLLLNILCFVHMVLVITCFGADWELHFFRVSFGFAPGFALLRFLLVCLRGFASLGCFWVGLRASMERGLGLHFFSSFGFCFRLHSFRVSCGWA